MNWMFRVGLAVTAFFISAGPSGAAPVASPHATTELVAIATTASPGSTLWVGVVQTLDPGWHTYWRNPGDAGEATSIRWTLPAGYRAGDIAWPAPKRLPVGPIMNYGYEGKVVLPTPIRISADAKPGQTASIVAAVDYLVCAEVCVPGSVTVSLDVPITSAPGVSDPRTATLFQGAVAATPKPAGLTATFTSTPGVPGTLKIAVVGEALAGTSAKDTYFYPYDETLIDHARPQTVERGRRGLTLSIAPGAAFAKDARPAKAAGVLEVDGRAYEIAAAPGPAPSDAAGLGPPETDTAPGSNLPLAMGGAFLGGLILNLMPCVFPILSMKAAALAGHAGEPGRARGQALAFLAGVLVSFLGLASALMITRAAGSAVGWGFQLQSPLAVGLLALVMLAAGLNLSGVFEVGTSAQGLGSGLAARNDLLGSCFTGVLAVVVAAPCTAPFMGPALGFALTQPVPVALGVFAALGLGFAAPFTLLSMTPGLIRRLPRPGVWMDTLKHALAFPMYAAAAWLAWVLAQQTDATGLARLFSAAVVLAMAGWLFGLAQQRDAIGRDRGALALGAAAAAGFAAAAIIVSVGDFAPPPRAGGATAAAAAGALPSEPWSEERLAALRASHTPVLVNFTAAWCVTCQVNERLAFSSGQVAAALRTSGAVYLVADWTNHDAAIAAALGRQRRIGVPLYLVYGADGSEPTVLPQLLTPGVVAEALRHAVRSTG